MKKMFRLRIKINESTYSRQKFLWISFRIITVTTAICNIWVITESNLSTTGWFLCCFCQNCSFIFSNLSETLFFPKTNLSIGLLDWNNFVEYLISSTTALTCNVYPFIYQPIGFYRTLFEWSVYGQNQIFIQNLAERPKAKQNFPKRLKKPFTEVIICLPVSCNMLTHNSWKRPFVLICKPKTIDL